MQQDAVELRMRRQLPTVPYVTWNSRWVRANQVMELPWFNFCHFRWRRWSSTQLLVRQQCLEVECECWPVLHFTPYKFPPVTYMNICVVFGNSLLNTWFWLDLRRYFLFKWLSTMVSFECAALVFSMHLSWFSLTDVWVPNLMWLAHILSSTFVTPIHVLKNCIASLPH